MKTIALLLAGLFPSSAWAEVLTDPAIKSAIEKGLARIEAGAANYPRNRQCFSCHHQALAVFSMTSAKRHGLTINADLLKNQIDFSLKTFRNTTSIAKGQGVGGDTTSVVYALNTFAAVDRPYDETIAALVQYLLVRQRKDGSWPIAVRGERPPTMGSLFTNVGLAMLVLRKYGPPESAAGAHDLQLRIDAAVKNGRDWLLANQPVSTEDKVFQLRGLLDAGAPCKDIDAARQRLITDQLADGSWPQLADMSGDAYATATALVVLRKAGLESNHQAYRQGVKYLLGSQKEDGAWIVQTRSKPVQIYFDNGDAGGKSQFISFAATGWAVLALLEAMPR